MPSKRIPNKPRTKSLRSMAEGEQSANKVPLQWNALFRPGGSKIRTMLRVSANKAKSGARTKLRTRCEQGWGKSALVEEKSITNKAREQGSNKVRTRLRTKCANKVAEQSCEQSTNKEARTIRTKCEQGFSR